MTRLLPLSPEEWSEKIKYDRDTDNLCTHENISRYREYTQGKQDCYLTEEMLDILNMIRSQAEEFADNICNQIVSEARDRVRFLGWKCRNAPVAKWLSTFYKTCQVKKLSSTVHYNAFRDGNTLVHLYWDKDAKRVKLINDEWWDGVSGTFANYTLDGVLEYVVKEWVEDAEESISRRTIYIPGKILRYISRGSNAVWEPYEKPDIDDPEQKSQPFPVDWERKNGEPLGIPYVNFPNTGWGEVIAYGFSELHGGIIGFQNRMNSISWDMLLASKLTGCPIYTAAGVTDTEGGKVGPGELWSSANYQASFGIIQPGSQESNIAIYNLTGRRVAQISRTPAHIIIGAEWPSGEALMRAELPAIGKADSQIDGLYDPWVQLAHRAIEIQNVFGDGRQLIEDPEKALIIAKFGPTERRDSLSQSTVISNIKDNLSRRKSLERMGYEEDEIEENEEELSSQKDQEFKRMQEAAKLTGNNNSQQQNNENTNNRGPQGGKPNGGRGSNQNVK